MKKQPTLIFGMMDIKMVDQSSCLRNHNLSPSSQITMQI